MKKSDSLKLLNELSKGEDEFDVDLIACGCRLMAPGSDIHLSIQDMIRLYDLDNNHIHLFIGGLINESKLNVQDILKCAQKVSKISLKVPAAKEKSKTKMFQIDKEDNLKFSIKDIFRLYDMQDIEIANFAALLIERGKINSSKVFSLAEQASKGEIEEGLSEIIGKRKNN